jgi:hypothetical protein
MAIIRTAQNNVLIGFSYLNNYPDPFVSDAKKESDDYIKNTMDYFANMAYTQYRNNMETFVPNYDLLNGIIDRSHFSLPDPGAKDLLDMLTESQPLPDYVKHYSLINQPVNAMVGELSKRPDNYRIRALDDDSKSEELEYKTSIAHQYIMQEARNVIINNLALQGVDVSSLDPDQMEQMTMDEVKDELVEYTSLAEKWGNHMLTALKGYFNCKDKNEEAFRDLLASCREFFHIYEDTSKLGFHARVENPKNVWYKGTPDMRYTSGVSGESLLPYCIGTVYVKEISEIINELPELDIEEIEHLKKGVQNSLLLSGRESNLFTGQEGIQSIHYDTYNPLIWQERMIIQSEIGNDNNDDLRHWLGASNAFSFGYKYVVIKAYWNSKKKVGKLTYIDEEGDTQTTYVDENYKEDSPGQVSLEWGWVDQWYQGTKVGPDIYHMKPLAILDYAPIIGMIHNQKNSVPKSLVDLMKPLQVLFNVVMNQLYELLEKEIGRVGVINIRRVPKPKDGDGQDSIDIWMDEARAMGIIFDDDSPKNTQAPMSNTTVAQSIDLTRTQELQSRLSMAVQLQEMAWQLIGFNRQRLGTPTATETATANQNALVQSYAQTEPYFAAHGYVMNQFYQALIDAAKYIECSKPTSTVNWISSHSLNTFIQVMGPDLSFRDLMVFCVSRPEDQELFQEFRQLSQAALQNGASLYEISEMFSTNSIREMKRQLKDLKQMQDEYAQREQDFKQQELEQQAQQKKAEMEQQQRFHDDDIAIKKYVADVNANATINKQVIANYFQMPETDQNANGTPDPLDIEKHAMDVQEAYRKADLENQKLSLDFQKFQAEQQNKKKEFEIADKKIQNEKERNKIMSKKAVSKPKTPKKK